MSETSGGRPGQLRGVILAPERLPGKRGVIIS